MVIDSTVVDLESMLREQHLYDNPLTEKQKDIIQAAEKLFSETGYAETSTASIAREAGVTEKTLFKHFPTKRDLFRRILFPIILKTMVPLQIKIVQKMLRINHKTFRDFFKTLAIDRWTTARQLGNRLKLVLGEVLRHDSLREQLLQLAKKNVWPEVLANIEKFQRSGELRDDLRAEDIATFQISLILANALSRGVVATNQEFDDEKDVQLLMDMMFNGIGKR